MLERAYVLVCDNCGKRETISAPGSAIDIERVAKKGWAIEPTEGHTWCQRCWAVGATHWQDVRCPETDSDGRGIEVEA